MTEYKTLFDVKVAELLVHYRQYHMSFGASVYHYCFSSFTESTKDRAAELQPTLSDKERTGDANELPAGVVKI